MAIDNKPDPSLEARVAELEEQVRVLQIQVQELMSRPPVSHAS